MTTKSDTNIAALAALFPAAFSAEPWQAHRPLKVGIGAVCAIRTRRASLGEQVRCDHRATARRRRTLRLVQGIAAFIRFESLQLSCSNDRA
jgi:sRNA-binding protein